MLALRTSTGRDLAIVGASWLDAAVELNLRYNMTSLAGQEPDPQVFFKGVRGLEARLWVAEAFGLFGDSTIRHQADLVRRVRNALAHTIDDLNCDSSSIAPLIDQMTLTTESVTQSLLIDPNTVDPRNSQPWWFTFDGEDFRGDQVSVIGAENPDRIVFFVPRSPEPVTRDDRLRRQIYATVFGVLGLGLKPWINDTGNDGVVDITGWEEEAARRAHEW